MKSIRFYVLISLFGATVGLAIGACVYQLGVKLDRIAVAVEALDILGRRKK